MYALKNKISKKNDEFTLAVFHFLVKLYVVENEVFTRVRAVGFYRYVIQSQAVDVSKINTFCGQNSAVHIHFGVVLRFFGNVTVVRLHPAIQLQMDISKGDIFQRAFLQPANVTSHLPSAFRRVASFGIVKTFRNPENPRVLIEVVILIAKVIPSHHFVGFVRAFRRNIFQSNIFNFTDRSALRPTHTLPNVYEDGGVYVTHFYVFNGYAVHDCAVYAFNGNTANTRFANVDIFNVDIFKSAIGFRTKLNGVATAFNFTIPNANILAYTQTIKGVRRFEYDTVVPRFHVAIMNADVLGIVGGKYRRYTRAF